MPVANGLGGSSSGKGRFKTRDAKRKPEALKLSQLGFKTVDIAKEMNCSRRHARRLLQKARKPDATVDASKQPWFNPIAINKLSELRSVVLVQPVGVMTTDILVEKIRDVSENELRQNTFPFRLSLLDEPVSETKAQKKLRTNKEKSGREWARTHFSGDKKGSMGFVLMDAHDEDLDEAKLLELYDSKRYSKEFDPIFQQLQAKKKVDVKGDSTRRQAKLSDLAALAELRVEEASAIVNAQRKKRRTTTASDPSLDKSLDEAQAKLREIEAELETIEEAINFACRGYERIRKVRLC